MQNIMQAPPISLSERFVQREAERAAKRANLLMQDAYAVPFVALTVIIMAYSSLFSMVPILVFYMLWLPQLYIKGIRVVRPTGDLVASMLLPALCCLSVVWSDYRNVTIHKGLELVSMVLCVIIMARVVSTQSFARGLIAGATLTIIATLVNGTYGMDYFSGTYSLVGLFGSKNQVGFVSEIGMLASFAVLLAKTKKMEKFVFSFIPIMLFCISLYLSKSATAVLTLAIVLCAMVSLYAIAKLPRRIRLAVVLITFFLMTAVVTLALNSGLVDTILAGFGKDTTLTGRTYLWSEGFKIGLESPFFGHGYAAFWVPGQPQAEKYWYEFTIFGKSGFHFHELFIQSFVDMGIVGFLIISAMILSNLFRMCGRVIRSGSDLEYMLLLGIAVMFAIRAFVEVDFWGPFGMGELLFFSVIPRLSAYEKNQK